MNGAVAHYCGVQLCGSIHLCAVCSPRIRQERANDIDAGAKAWIAEHGPGSISLLTLTMPHDHGDRLKSTLDTIKGSFSALVSGRAWQSDKAAFDLAHYIVSHDSTVGKNGWHPHLHILLFGARALTDHEVGKLRARLHERWSGAVAKRGYRLPSLEYGVQLERARNRSDVAKYVCQVVAGDATDDLRTVPVALEMARGDLKTSRHNGQRTPWQLLSDLTQRRARDGEWTDDDEKADTRDLALWHEWETESKGLRAIRWSKGLRKRVGLAAQEKTDEEIVAEEVGGVDLYSFVDVDSWKAVASTPGARARVLRAAETGGKKEVDWLVYETLLAWRARRARYGIEGKPPAKRTKPRRNDAMRIALAAFVKARDVSAA